MDEGSHSMEDEGRAGVASGDGGQVVPRQDEGGWRVDPYPGVEAQAVEEGGQARGLRQGRPVE
eukprot:425958-Alexandrium_andersonii.AAC.1